MDTFGMDLACRAVVIRDLLLKAIDDRSYLYFNWRAKGTVVMRIGALVSLSRYFFLMFSLICIVSIVPASAEELKGKVASVSGKRVHIELAGPLLPQPGDKVQISETVPGVGELPLKGSWRVIVVDQKGVVAEPGGDAGQPHGGQRVVIHSDNPRSATELQRDVEKLYQRGQDYFNGANGVAKDYKKAFTLFNEAAAKGYAPAQADLGYMYHNGLGVKKDEGKSFDFTRKAAMQGDLTAQYNIGLKYFYGTGVKKDRTEAAKWFRKAADRGYLNAISAMGDAYYFGHGVEQDYSKAAMWHRKAAERGHADSQCELGKMYIEGKGLPKDVNQARNWLQKSADQNSAGAQMQLGILYWEDDSLPDYREIAFGWFKKAARQGNSGGQQAVGVFYEHGWGVAKDINKAVYWYRKAAAQGDESAKQALARLGPVSAQKSGGTSKSAANVSAGAASYISMLKSSDAGERQKGAKALYHSPYKREPEVLAAVNAVLLEGFNSHVRNSRHADAMAWLCNILGASGDKRYQATLKKLSRESKNRKVRKFAGSNYRKLR
jgi:TPR repeat protein